LKISEDMTISPTHIIPSFARRLLRIGPMPPALLPRCESGVEIMWFQEKGTLLLNQAVVKDGVDCILISTSRFELSELHGILVQAAMILDPAGRITVVIEGPDRPPWDEAMWDQVLSGRPFMRYRTGVLNDDALWALTMVCRNYDPVAHARFLVDTGRLDCGLEVIDEIPLERMADSAHLARLAVEKQKYLVQRQLMRKGQDPHQALFGKVRREFAQLRPSNRFCRNPTAFMRRSGPTWDASTWLCAPAGLD
jgi:hypothetical protein